MAAEITQVVLMEGDLRLRPPRREEAALYARWWQDDEVCFAFCCEPRTEADLAAAFPELEAEARDIGHWIDYVIEVGGRPIGSIWLSRWDLDAATCDLNILIGEPEYRRQGLSRRAIRLLCAWAFPTMELRRINLCPREDHIPAVRCYLGAGARLDGIEADVSTWRGDVVCYQRLYFLPEDFPEGPSSSAAE